MRIAIRQKNLEVTPSLRTYLTAKVLKPVRRFLKDRREEFPIIDIEVERITRHHRKGRVYRVAVNMALDGKLVRAEVEDGDVRAACDLLEEELEREIATYRSRSRSRERRQGRRIKKDLHFSRGARLFRKGRIREEGD